MNEKQISFAKKLLRRYRMKASFQEAKDYAIKVLERLARREKAHLKKVDYMGAAYYLKTLKLLIP